MSIKGASHWFAWMPSGLKVLVRMQTSIWVCQECCKNTHTISSGRSALSSIHQWTARILKTTEMSLSFKWDHKGEHALKAQEGTLFDYKFDSVCIEFSDCDPILISSREHFCLVEKSGKIGRKLAGMAFAWGERLFSTLDIHRCEIRV